jgi:hypothetical protein
MGGNNSAGIKALKGKGRSKQLKDIEFPVEISEEVLTRIEASVSVNNEGIPTYMTNERSLAKRFQKLLEDIGKIPYKEYSRGQRYEIRYPKFLQEIFDSLDFEKDFSAQVDEIGKIEGGKLKASGTEVSVEDFSGKLYSREKKFELALQRGDDETIHQIIGGEASKVNSLLGR